jgi:hypothetical protein
VQHIVLLLDIIANDCYCPAGLLDLGRRELLLSFLSTELLQYAPLLPHPAGVAGQPLTDVRCAASLCYRHCMIPL